MDERHASLLETIGNLPPVDEDGDQVEAVLTKFVLVAEWVDAEGSKYLIKRSANGMGEPLPEWDIEGVLFHSLFAKGFRLADI